MPLFSTCLNRPLYFTVQPPLSRGAFPGPTRLDPLLLGPMVLSVTQTVMQDRGGPQTGLSNQLGVSPVNG